MGGILIYGNLLFPLGLLFTGGNTGINFDPRASLKDAILGARGVWGMLSAPSLGSGSP